MLARDCACCGSLCEAGTGLCACGNIMWEGEGQYVFRFDSAAAEADDLRGAKWRPPLSLVPGAGGRAVGVAVARRERFLCLFVTHSTPSPPPPSNGISPSPALFTVRLCGEVGCGRNRCHPTPLPHLEKRPLQTPDNLPHTRFRTTCRTRSGTASWSVSHTDLRAELISLEQSRVTLIRLPHRNHSPSALPRVATAAPPAGREGRGEKASTIT